MLRLCVIARLLLLSLALERRRLTLLSLGGGLFLLRLLPLQVFGLAHALDLFLFLLFARLHILGARSEVFLGDRNAIGSRLDGLLERELITADVLRVTLLKPLQNGEHLPLGFGHGGQTDLNIGL